MIRGIPHNHSESALSGIGVASGVAEVWAAANENCIVRRIGPISFAPESWRIVSPPSGPRTTVLGITLTISFGTDLCRQLCVIGAVYERSTAAIFLGASRECSSNRLERSKAQRNSHALGRDLMFYV
jgi:hypothetical protein